MSSSSTQQKTKNSSAPRSQKQKKLNPQERFFLIFAGDHLTFYLNGEVTSSNEEETLIAPLMVEGYLLDMDDHNYYIGATPEEIDRFITISSVMYGGRFSEQSTHDALLDSISNNPKKNEIN